MRTSGAALTIRRWSAAAVVFGLFLAACSSEPKDQPPQGVDVARLSAEVNGFLANVELSADRLAKSFDGDQPRDGTDFHVKSFARR